MVIYNKEHSQMSGSLFVHKSFEKLTVRFVGFLIAIMQCCSIFVAILMFVLFLFLNIGDVMAKFITEYVNASKKLDKA